MPAHNTTVTLQITEAIGNVERLMPLLLIGDESTEMILRYLPECRVFAGSIDGCDIAVCAITVNKDKDNCIEIKNLAVATSMRRKGVGRAMLAHIEALFPGYNFCLGTGETPSTLRFYHSCGYVYSHRIKDFFIDNYDHPIVEEGIRLKDMLYLTKKSERIKQ